MEIDPKASIDDSLIDWMKQKLSDDEVILELGSGAGTEILNMYWKVISIEHNEAFMTIPNHHYIYAPLKKHKPIQNYESDNQWYNPRIVEKYTKNLEYNVLLIDGPPGQSRTGLVKYFSLFDPKAMWIFDDLDRTREKHLIHAISRRLKRPYTVYNAWGPGKAFGVIDNDIC